MKTIKNVKTISVMKTNAMFSPSNATQYYSPFLIGMAKGLRLVSEAVKLGCQQVYLLLDSYKAIGVLSCYIPKTINPLKYDVKSIGRN